MVTAALLLFIVAGIALRCAVDLRHGLWEDEIIAVTHAMQPFPSILVEIARNDIHPPLYFLQLHLWALAGHSDRWFVANSVGWGVVSIWSLWSALRREGQSALALPAAACLAVLPSALWMSQEVRPYAWLCVLLIWAFHFTRSAFTAHRARAGDLLAVFGLCAAMILSHAIGFLAPFFLGVYAATILVERRASRRQAVVWLTCFGLLGLMSVPMLVSNMLHDANLPGASTASAIVACFAEVVTISAAGGSTHVLGLLVFIGLVGFGLAEGRTRVMTACLILLPMLVAVALGAAYKPIFKPNFFGTLLTPFAAIVLGQLALSLRERWRGVVVAGLLVLSLSIRLGRDTTTGYRDAALLIRSEARAGDVVLVPQVSMFWGMAWYLDRPGWGSPLAVADLPNPQWRTVYRRLGPELVRRLGLMPAAQTIIAPDGLALIIGDQRAQAARGKRVWLVTDARADLPRGFPPGKIGSMHQDHQRKVYALTLTLYD